MYLYKKRSIVHFFLITTQGAELSIAWWRNVQMAKRPGGETSRGRNVQGANRPGGELTKGRNVHKSVTVDQSNVHQGPLVTWQ